MAPGAWMEMGSTDTMTAWAVLQPQGPLWQQQQPAGPSRQTVNSRAIIILSPLLAVLGKSQLCPWLQLTLHRDDFYSSSLSP